MSKKINFRARSKSEFDLQLKPYPAVKSLPKWFLDASPYEDIEGLQNGKIHVRNREANASFKKCVPLLDSMGSGYIIPLWADVQVHQGTEGPELHWRTRNNLFEMHGTGTKKIQPPSGYDSQVFKYLNCWIPQTPPGYSCLVISPNGHNDLVFKAVPAIVDTDKSTLELVFPVWIKSDFNGIVEKGTPIAQIIPFKRDNWDSTFDYYEDNEYYNKVEEKNFNSTIVSHYIKNHWSKKTFK